jgi:hypothetical protein
MENIAARHCDEAISAVTQEIASRKTGFGKNCLEPVESNASSRKFGNRFSSHEILNGYKNSVRCILKPEWFSDFMIKIKK